jgi:hypothetical protein
MTPEPQQSELDKAIEHLEHCFNHAPNCVVCVSSLKEVKNASKLSLAQSKEIERLVKDSTYPGAWECEKCGFLLQKHILSALFGNADNSPLNEICPNDGKLMIPVTYKRAFEHSIKDRERQVKRAVKAEADLDRLRKSVGLCDKHQPDGGARNCLVCAVEKLSHALSRISYICGNPNEMQVSDYDTHYNEGEVVREVERLREWNEELQFKVASLEAEAMCKALGIPTKGDGK